MGYKPKDRVGYRSGDLEIIARAGRTADRELTWRAVCRRMQDGRECGNEHVIPTSRIDQALCCVPCAVRARAKINKGNSRYTWTPQIDEMIRRIHVERAGKRTSSIPSYAEYARRLGRPKSAVIQRARRLGLTPIAKEPEWSEEELRLLRRWSWKTPKVIQLGLKAAGFTRTLTAVTLKRKRLRLHASRAWVTARELAEMLGIDSHKVSRWISRGLLFGNWREHGQHGEYVIHEKAIRRFILMNPHEVDLRKVDQTWFFDIITEGKFGENYVDPIEERKRLKRERTFVESEKNTLLEETLGEIEDESDLIEHVEDYSKSVPAF